MPLRNVERKSYWLPLCLESEQIDLSLCNSNHHESVISDKSDPTEMAVRETSRQFLQTVILMQTIFYHVDLPSPSLDPINRIYARLWSDVQQSVARSQVYNEGKNWSEGKHNSPVDSVILMNMSHSPATKYT